MGNELDRFLAGAPRPLQLGALRLCIALAGALLAFMGDYGPGNPLAYVAIVVGLVGIATVDVAEERKCDTSGIYLVLTHITGRWQGEQFLAGGYGGGTSGCGCR